MSCWIASREHVAALARYFGDHHGAIPLELEPCAIAESLMRANEASYRTRYPAESFENDPPFTAEEVRNAPALSPLDAIKQCQCLEYQSSDAHTYYLTEPHNWLLRIQSVATWDYMTQRPEWQAAPWGI